MKLGWKRDLPDFRDHCYSVSMVPASLPVKVDLTPKLPEVYDQGELGSCTANAIAAACEYEWLQHKRGPDFIPSRLFIYYNERVLEHTVPYDSGASLRSGMKAINQWGFCKEPLWAYDIKQFTKRPPEVAYAEASPRKVYQYSRMSQARMQLCAAIASQQPIVFGFSVYESFMSKHTVETGVVPMPSYTDKLLGGHAVLMVGYDQVKQHYIFRNSYGKKWGAKGYGYLPFAYVESRDLAADFWVVKAV